MKEDRIKQTPYGLPRAVITGLYFLAMCITGMAVQAADPLQELMKMNGAYSHITNEAERIKLIASVVSFGLTANVLSGVIVGPTLDLLGSKFTGLLGLALHCLGYCFYFFNSSPMLYYVGSVCFGTGFQLILNAHLSVGCLFPRNSNLVLSMLAAAPDLSLFVPPTILSFAHHIGGAEGVQRSVFTYLVMCASVAGLIELFFLPFQRYSGQSTASTGEKQPLVSDPETGELVPQEKRVTVGSFYWPLSTLEQIKTPEYWVFLILFIFAFLRKKHMTVFIRPTFLELDSSPDQAEAKMYTSLYNTIVPYGFIPAMLWGGLVDRLGILPLMFVSNLLALVYLILSLIPVMSLQFITILVFIVQQAFLFSQALAFLCSTFGFETLATLNGISSSAVGIASILVDAFLAPHIHSYRAANVGILIATLIYFAGPTALVILRNQKIAAIRQMHHGAHEEVSLRDSQAYERVSVSAVPPEVLRNPGD